MAFETFELAKHAKGKTLIVFSMLWILLCYTCFNMLSHHFLQLTKLDSWYNEFMNEANIILLEKLSRSMSSSDAPIHKKHSFSLHSYFRWTNFFDVPTELLRLVSSATMNQVLFSNSTPCNITYLPIYFNIVGTFLTDRVGAAFTEKRKRTVSERHTTNMERLYYISTI